MSLSSRSRPLGMPGGPSTEGSLTSRRSPYVNLSRGGGIRMPPELRNSSYGADTQTNVTSTVAFQARAYKSAVQMEFTEPSSVFVLKSSGEYTHNNASTMADLPLLNEFLEQGSILKNTDAGTMATLPRYHMDMLARDRGRFFCNSVEEFREKWAYAGQIRSDMVQAALPYGGSYASNPPPGLYGTSAGAVTANIKRVLGVDVQGRTRIPNIFAPTVKKGQVLYYCAKMMESKSPYMQDSAGSIVGNYANPRNQILQVVGLTNDDSSTYFHNTNGSEWDFNHPLDNDVDYLELNKKVAQEYKELIWNDEDSTFTWRNIEDPANDVPELIYDAYATGYPIKLGVVSQTSYDGSSELQSQAHRDRNAMLRCPIVEMMRGV